MAYSALDLAFDLAIVALPILPISKLQLSARKKVMVIGVFALGALYVSILISEFVGVHANAQCL